MEPQGGYFHFIEDNKLRIVKNTLVKTGAEWILRDIFRNETGLWPANMYMGLTSAGYSFDGTTLAGLAAGEPVGNGYARQLITRANVDWTVTEVNGAMQALSKIVTFTCSVANWTQNYQRAFLCDAAAGGVGNVMAVSGPTPAPRIVTPGNGPSSRYEFWLRG